VLLLGEGGRLFRPLATTSLLHASERSRLAVAAVLLACAPSIALLIVVAEPSAFAVLLIFVLSFFGSIWIAQIHGARMLGQCARVTGGIMPARAVQVRRPAGDRCSVSARVLAVPAVAAALVLAVEPAQAATFTVDWTGDVGDSNRGDARCQDRGGNTCSLRAAIEEANATSGEDRIEFNIPGPPGTRTIQIVDSPDRDELEPIADPLTIEGPPFTDAPLIALRGTRSLEWGLKVTGGSTVIRGLAIRNFGSLAAGPDTPAEGAIVLEGNGGNRVQGNLIGADLVGGGSDLTQNGVIVRNSPDNTIGGDTPSAPNVISGNSHSGVLITGSAATGNRIRGNLIGTGRRGLSARPNADGITVRNAPDNAIGGAAPSARNVISGNSQTGVTITGAGGTGNWIAGNYIGTTASGETQIGNGSFGILLARPAAGAAASGTVIGGSATGERNVISGNGPSIEGQTTGVPTRGGILLEGGQGTRVEGNFIGTDHLGQSPLPNTNGVIVRNSRDNVIGSAVPGARNLISGNGLSGVMITGGGSTGNRIRGNFIGTDESGEAQLGNSSGILLTLPVGGQPSSGTVIGGTEPGAGNVISGNGDGIQVVEGGQNRIMGNLIGTNWTGKALLRPATDTRDPVGNNRDGVNIRLRAGAGMPGTTVGGGTAGARNVISGNGRDGVRIAGPRAQERNVREAPRRRVAGPRAGGQGVRGNLIGTDSDGKPTLGNGENGVSVLDGARHVVVGCKVNSPTEACAAGSNTIAGNRGHGVSVAGASAEGATTEGVTIRANDIFANGPRQRQGAAPGLGIDLGEPGVTANDTGDGDTGPNALLNFPVGVSATRNRTGNTTITGGIDGPVADKPGDRPLIDLYASDSVDPYPAFGEGAEWIAAVRPDRAGNFAHALPAGASVQGKFISATATDRAGNTSEFSAVCGDPDRDGNTDSDGDALCDDWEIHGIDYNGDRGPDLPLRYTPYSADPKKKDIFVEIDYMERKRGRRVIRSQRPSSFGLRMVQSSFAAPPIGADGKPVVNLHLSPNPERPDLWDEPVPETKRPLRFRNGPGDWQHPDDLYDIKHGDPADPCDGSFGTSDDKGDKTECGNRLGARRLVFRYALFARSLRSRALGETELHGNDIVVATGSVAGDDAEVAGGDAPECAGEACRENLEANTFMHELGHSLGLGHGGGGAKDYKPNYLSVMNDFFVGQNYVEDRPLDYSRWKLAPLNEFRLDERRGILDAGTPAPEGLEKWRTAYSVRRGTTCVVETEKATGPIDWNGVNGIQALADPARGIDEPPEKNGPSHGCKTAENRELTSFADWPNLRYGFRDNAIQFGNSPTMAEIRAGASAADSDRDGISNLDDNCRVVANPAQADRDGDGIGDPCAALITDVNLAVRLNARPGRADIGDDVVLSALVTNDWPIAAPGISLSVVVPAGFRVRDVEASQGSYAPTTGIWRVGELAKRGRAKLTITTRAVAAGGWESVGEVTRSARPDRNSTPGNGDPLEDDRASATVRTVASRAAGVISTVAGGWTGPTPAIQTGQEPVATAVRGSTLYVADAHANQVKAVDLESGLETLVAGNGMRGAGGDGGPARAASLALSHGLDESGRLIEGLGESGGLVVDAADNLYIADTNNHRVRRVSADGRINTIAGTGVPGFGGDGGPASAARLQRPLGLALDGAGTLYVADSGNMRVRAINRQGRISTVASLSLPPMSVAVRPNGNLLVTPGPQGSSASGSVLEVAPDGATSIFAGGGPRLDVDDPVPATAAYLSYPVHVAVDPAGRTYITDNEYMRILVVGLDGTLRRWAGDIPPFNEPDGIFRGDPGPALRADLAHPTGVAFDATGNGYIADRGNHRVRRVDPEGNINTVAGNGSCCVSAERGPAATAQLGRPGGIAVDSTGSITFVDQENFSAHLVDPAGQLERLAGLDRPTCVCPAVDQPRARLARLDQPSGVAVSAPGTTYFDDRDRNRQAFVYRVEYHPELGDAFPHLAKVAGKGFGIGAGDGGKALEEPLFGPLGLAVDAAGNLYIAEAGSNLVRRVDHQGIITTVAGTGTEGDAGDGGDAKRARLRAPEDVKVAADGSLYVADTGNHRVRRIDANGKITTVAGSGKKGFSGDGRRAVTARLNQPSDIALDANGNLYVADRGNHRLRLVTAAGTILTIAGTGSRGLGGDGGLPTAAPLESPDGLALDHRGQLLVSAGRLIRRLQAPSGPALYISDARVKEGTGRDRPARLTVTLLEPARSEVSVRFTTVDRTAKAPADYAATSGVLNFGPGEVSKRISVPIVGDRVKEKRERFEIALSGASAGASLADLVAQVSIPDDD
jgi:sugar lactone lactonase YvrE